MIVIWSLFVQFLDCLVIQSTLPGLPLVTKIVTSSGGIGGICVARRVLISHLLRPRGKLHCAPIALLSDPIFVIHNLLLPGLLYIVFVFENCTHTVIRPNHCRPHYPPQQCLIAHTVSVNTVLWS